MNALRKKLDSITMYRVMLYTLGFLVATSLVFSVAGWVTYASAGTLVGMLLVVSAVCYGANIALSKLYGITPNYESSAITAFILYFVLGSPSSSAEWIGVGLAAVIAIASKYAITWRGSHIFNPAAFGVLVVSLIGVGSGAWWIANEAMFIPMLIVAFVVLLKIRRFGLFAAFALPAVLTILLTTQSGQPLDSALVTIFTLFPLLFLGSIMLTEPATMPSTRYLSILYAAIVGFLFGYNFDIGFIGASPHLALLLGNLFAFVVAARTGAFLTLVEKTKLTPTTYEFAFKPSRPIPRLAGQYMEFTLPGIGYNNRGNRRTFTVASAPNDALIRIGVKFYEGGSLFKQKLSSLSIGDKIMGGHVAGDFTLPEDKAVPVVFIAGGIGVTPFIAMISQLIADNSKRDVTLYYFAAEEAEVAYKDVLEQAKKAGITTELMIGRDARLSPEAIASHQNAHFYISGPPGMVAAYKKQLKAAGVGKIHTDLFTGY